MFGIRCSDSHDCNYQHGQCVQGEYACSIGFSYDFSNDKCGAEAEYAFSQRKEIVPLLIESAYRPDGWLGMIQGAKLFFDFSGKYSYDSRIEGLKKEVKQRRVGTERGMSEDVVDAGPKQQPVVAEKAPVSFRPQPAAHFDDVKKWLTKHN